MTVYAFQTIFVWEKKKKRKPFVEAMSVCYLVSSTILLDRFSSNSVSETHAKCCSIILIFNHIDLHVIEPK
jgi:hypothetical protein